MLLKHVALVVACLSITGPAVPLEAKPKPAKDKASEDNAGRVPDETRKRVDDAVAKGCAWLQQRVTPDPSHPQDRFGRGGTWLAGYALALNGAPPDDPVLNAILPFPEELEKTDTSSLSHAILFLSRFHPANDSGSRTRAIKLPHGNLLQKAVDVLSARRGKAGAFHDLHEGHLYTDNYPCQGYPLIALDEAVSAGASVPKDLWKTALSVAVTYAKRQLTLTPGHINTGSDIDRCRCHLLQADPAVGPAVSLLDRYAETDITEEATIITGLDKGRSLLLVRPWNLLFYAHMPRTPKIESHHDKTVPNWRATVCENLLETQQKDGCWHETLSVAGQELPSRIQASLALIFLSQFRSEVPCPIAPLVPE